LSARLFGRLGPVLLVTFVVAAAAASTAMGETRLIPAGGTGAPVTGAFTPSGPSDLMKDEFAAEPRDEDGAAAADNFDGTIAVSSASQGANGRAQFNMGFEGLNFYQQRYSRGGNQFSVEPPDQALCVGNGFELEAVNDVLNVFDATGASALPDNTSTNIVSGFPRNVNHAVDLNSFFGYPPAINRTTGIRGQFVTDPSCLYDAQTQRFFVTVLTLEVVPTTGAFTHVNHLDIAVSKTSNPTGQWTIYHVDVTNDGTNTGGKNPGPYLGDYPHIGADANGFYVTTNAYPWCCDGFSGAQIYAFSKAQMAAGSPVVNMQHLDTSGTVNAPSDAGSTQPGFTVWPAQSPNGGGGDDESAAGGTEFFLSSNAADEAQVPVAGTGGPQASNQIVVWKLANTASLNTPSPSLALSNQIVSTEQYGRPPKAQQPGSGLPVALNAPQGFCINDTTTPTLAGTGCWRLLFAGEPAHTEVVSTLDANDTRMQQVMFANGRLFGALDTAVNPDGAKQRAGIAWFVIKAGSARLENQGYLGAAGHDFTYPAIGVTSNARGLMAFTDTGDSTFPSAAFAPIDRKGVGSWNDVQGGAGAAPDDGFTSYKAQVGNPPRTRWGDYGAAAVDGNSIWIASEYIASSCNYTDWGGPFFTGGTGDNLLGTCGGAAHGPGKRAALGNWSTRISQFSLGD
jgi:hypothetical protein